MTEIASNTPKPSDIFRRLEQLEADGAITPKGQSILDGARQQGLWSAAPQRGFMDHAGEYASTAVNALKAAPGAISDAWTGEGQAVEFPDAKEISDIEDIGFWESFWPNVKAGLTTDSAEKAKIYAQSFKEDPRFGGAGKDEHGNAYLVWNNKPYYVNSPGASMTDATDLVAQLAQLLPASKYAGKGLTVASRAGRGVPAYGATNIAQQYGAVAAGGKDAVDVSEAGQAGLIGGAAEALMPPALNALGKVARPVTKKHYTGTLDNFSQSKGDIPLTQGQRSGNMNLLRREEAMRQGAEGDIASNVMRGFDERQMDAIGQKALGLESRIGAGVGNKPSSVTDIGSRLKEDLIAARDQSKEAVRSAYKQASEKRAVLSVDAARDMARDMASVPKQMQVFSTDGMSQLNAALKKLDYFNYIAAKGKLKPANVQMIERFRQGLNTAIQGTQGTERAALRQMKSTMDKHMARAIDEGLLSGDAEAVEMLKNARSLRMLHARRFEAGRSDRTGNAMIKVLDQNGATPIQTVNYIVNTGKATGQDVALGMVRRLKDIFGPDSEQIRLIKSAYLLKAFSTTRNGERVIDRRALVANAREMMTGDGKAIAGELFSKSERDAVSKAANDISRTITPDDARNPSRSAFAFITGLMDRGIISSSMSSLRFVPFLDGAGNAIRNATGAVSAGQLTRQGSSLPSAPVVTAGGAAAGNAIRENGMLKP